MATTTQPFAGKTISGLTSFFQFLQRELAPTPGRRSAAVRVAISACIITTLGEVGRSQGLFIALFVLLSMPRDYPKQTWKSALQILACVWGVAPVALLLQVLAADITWLRVFALGPAIFFCLIIGRGLRLPLAGILPGVVLSEAIIQWDVDHDPQKNVEFILWYVLMISTGVLVGTAVEFLYPHQSALQRIAPGIAERLDAVSAVLKDKAGEPLSREESQMAGRLPDLALAGTNPLRIFLPAVSFREISDESVLLRLSSILTGIEVLVSVAAQLLRYRPDYFNDDQRRYLLQLRTRCRDLTQAILEQNTTPPAGPAAFEMNWQEIATSQAVILPRLAFLVEDLWEIWYGQAPSSLQIGQIPRQDLRPPKKRSAPPGPFFTQDNIRFAFKTALASVLCYILYNGIDWPGISTSVVTCFIVALDTVGATFRKLALRLAGVAVGGLLFGIGGIALVLSNLSNIVELLLVVAAVFFISGWVVKASQRISYAGVQIGLSFALVAMNTPAIPDQIAEARDRFMGVLLGAIVMWFVFRQFWPVSAIAAQRSNIASLVTNAADLTVLVNQDSSREEKIGAVRDIRDSSGQSIFLANEQADAAGFDSRRNPALQARIRDCFSCSRAVLLMSLVETEFVVARTLPPLPPFIHDAAEQYRSEYAENLRAWAQMIANTADHSEQSFQNRMADEHWIRYSEFLDHLHELEHDGDCEKRLYAQTRIRILQRNRELAEQLSDSIHSLITVAQGDTHR